MASNALTADGLAGQPTDGQVWPHMCRPNADWASLTAGKPDPRR